MKRPRYLWTWYFVVKSLICAGFGVYAAFIGDPEFDTFFIVAMLSAFVGAPVAFAAESIE